MTICQVQRCEQEAKRKGMCGKHYQRAWKYGDPLTTKRGRIVDTCVADDCARPPRSLAAQYCEMHYYRVRRHGDPSVVSDRKLDVVAYRAAHARIAVERGGASGYACVDCGHRAEHWSYNHTDPDELTSPTGQPYSLDSMHYEPRCRSCHAVFDGTGANQYSYA